MGTWTPGPAATEGNDQYVGDDSDEVVDGLGGIDTLDGEGGSDTLYGGEGGDTLDGGLGNNTLIGGGGGDLIISYGNDIIDGGDGLDFAWLVARGSETTPITMNLGDVVEARTWGATTWANVENVRILLGSGNDTIFVNRLVDAIGVEGGGGLDTIIADFSTSTDRVMLSTDAVSATFGYHTFTYVERIIATGGSGDDILRGGVFDDTLIGGAGDDILDSGAGGGIDGGIDTMSGGKGNDYYLTDGGDTLTELKNQGIDTVEARSDWTLGNHFENLTIIGVAANATGNGQKNVIIGYSGDDVLDGKQAADRLVGGLGDDTYVVDHQGDVVIEEAGQGVDTMKILHSRYLSDNVENLVLGGAADINGGGNELNNVIRGNGGVNSLYGEGGDDLIYSGLGNDRLYGGSGADAFLFNAAPGETNRDTIMDFNAADDTIRLDNAIFTALGANGALNADFFRIGSAAADANDYILYTSGGSLLYDADGNGAGAAVRFAIVSGAPALTAADFLVT